MNAATATRTPSRTLSRRGRIGGIAERHAHYRGSAGPPGGALSPDTQPRTTKPPTTKPPKGVAERELTALWLLGRVPDAVLPWPLLRAGRAGRGPGPDVREAVFVRAGVPFAGDVEVHLRGSDFRRHGHSADRAYDGVVLHLVWEDDRGCAVPLAGGPPRRADAGAGAGGGTAAAGGTGVAGRPPRRARGLGCGLAGTTRCGVAGQRRAPPRARAWWSRRAAADS